MAGGRNSVKFPPDYSVYRYVTFPDQERLMVRMDEIGEREKINDLRLLRSMKLKEKAKKEAPIPRIYVPKVFQHTYSEYPDVYPVKLALYCYIMIHRGLDDEMYLDLNRLITYWYHAPAQVYKGKLKDDILKSLYEIQRLNLISYKSLSEKTNNSVYHIKLNMNKIYSLCGLTKAGCAELHVDEIKKLLKEPRGTYLLSVFTAIKFKIYERNEFDDDWGYRTAEVCRMYYGEIQKLSNLSDRKFEGCLQKLEELDMIRYIPTRRYTYYNREGVMRTKISRAYFCLYERRRDGKIIESGKEYYMRELALAIKRTGMVTVFDKIKEITGVSWQDMVETRDKKYGQVQFGKDDLYLYVLEKNL